MQRKPFQKFIIVSAARTGSNYLRTMLGTHSAIKMFGEPFNLDGLSKTELNATLKNPLQYLDSILSENNSKSVTGFKFFYDHLTPEYFTKLVNKNEACVKVKRRFENLDKYLCDNFDLRNLHSILKNARSDIETNRRFKIIHLIRSNKLKSFLSLKKAYLTDQWFSLGKGDNLDKKIRIDFEECREYFIMLDNYEIQHRNLFKNHKYIEVKYENLVRHRDEELKIIFEFLEVPYEKVKSVLCKQNNSSMAQSIVNYAEIKDKFALTPWFDYFDE